MPKILVNGNYIKGLFSYTIENNGSTHYRAEDKDKRTFILECSESVESFCRLEFSCDEVIFCFNDFFSDAWFEVTDNK